MKTDCANCAHHDVFWKGSGYNKKSGMEPCIFESKESRDKKEEERI